MKIAKRFSGSNTFVIVNAPFVSSSDIK